MSAILLYDHDPRREGEEPPDEIIAYDPHDPQSVEAAREVLMERMGVDVGALLVPPASRFRRLLQWITDGGSDVR
ncbi:MAG: hypothetical protein R3F43_12160 [bacterium]